MKLYKRPYFNLFSAICSAIENLEKISQENNLPSETEKSIRNEIEELKVVQQKSEEFIISD